MAKYINAKTLKLMLNREHLNYTQMIEKKLVLQIIDNMPQADVVEIVRCKDCKKQNECGLYVDSEPEWFCADGERREIK